jgi:hypothetical protein
MLVEMAARGLGDHDCDGREAGKELDTRLSDPAFADPKSAVRKGSLALTRR